MTKAASCIARMDSLALPVQFALRRASLVAFAGTKCMANRSSARAHEIDGPACLLRQTLTRFELSEIAASEHSAHQWTVCIDRAFFVKAAAGRFEGPGVWRLHRPDHLRRVFVFKQGRKAEQCAVATRFPAPSEILGCAQAVGSSTPGASRPVSSNAQSATMKDESCIISIISDGPASPSSIRALISSIRFLVAA